jgi:hypothetical protein
MEIDDDDNCDCCFDRNWRKLDWDLEFEPSWFVFGVIIALIVMTVIAAAYIS